MPGAAREKGTVPDGTAPSGGWRLAPRDPARRSWRSWGPAPCLGRARGRCVRVRLEDLLARLPGADAVGLLDGHDEHLAVAHGAGPGVLEDRVDDRLHVTVGDHALQLDLRSQVVRDLGAAVALRD